MALGRVNLVDAIYWQVPVIARYNTAVTRVGEVVSLGTGGIVNCTVGGVTVPCQSLKGQTLVAADIVLLLCTTTSWWIIGVVPPSA